jgi:hypothetical protein
MYIKYGLCNVIFNIEPCDVTLLRDSHMSLTQQKWHLLALVHTRDLALKFWGFIHTYIICASTYYIGYLYNMCVHIQWYRADFHVWYCESIHSHTCVQLEEIVFALWGEFKSKMIKTNISYNPMILLNFRCTHVCIGSLVAIHFADLGVNFLLPFWAAIFSRTVYSTSTQITQYKKY